MAQSNFSAGRMFATPAGGNPIIFGALQDVSCDISFDQKMLYGHGSFAIEQARGKGKIDLKATVGRIDPLLFNGIFFGQTATTGETLVALAETATIAGSSNTPANTLVKDLGVFNVTTQKWMQPMTGSPVTTGKYKIVTAAYDFASADAGQVVQLYYTYASPSTGTTLAITNPTMGAGPIFSVDLFNQFRGKTLTLSFPAVQAFKLSMPLKQDDFLIPAIDFSAQDDGGGNILTASITG